MLYTEDCPPQETNVPTPPCPGVVIAVDPCTPDGSTLFHALVCQYDPAAFADWCAVPANSELAQATFSVDVCAAVATTGQPPVPTGALPVTGPANAAPIGALGLVLVFTGTLVMRLVRRHS